MSELWPRAAAAQGWDPRDRDRRLAIINEVLAHHPHPARRRVITSTRDLDSNTDYTLIKNRFLLLADSLTGALEDGDLTPNALRQRREIIRRLIKQLADTLDQAPHNTEHAPRTPQNAGGASVPASRVPSLAPRPSSRTPAENYVKQIIHDTTARAGFEPESFIHAPFEKILSSLDQPALDHLIITLKARLHVKQTPPPS
jgi:hypothetical protein